MISTMKANPITFGSSFYNSSDRIVTRIVSQLMGVDIHDVIHMARKQRNNVENTIGGKCNSPKK